MTTEGCASHPDLPPAAHCAACDRPLCADCWRSVVDDRPICQACVRLLRQPIPALVSVIAAALGLVILIRIGWIFRPTGWFTWSSYGFAALLVVVSAWRLRASANQRRRGRVIGARPLEASASLAGAGHPYRGAVRRSARRLAPPVSGMMATFVVASALVITAAAVPALFRLPRWLELELVLAGWWLIWTVALTVLLYRGWRVAKDPS